jgi:hypothetical protein
MAKIAWSVTFPSVGVRKPVVVLGDTRYEAAMRAFSICKEKGLMPSNLMKVQAFALASVERVIKEKPGRKKWLGID